MGITCWKHSLAALLLFFSVLYVFMIYTLIRSSVSMYLPAKTLEAKLKISLLYKQSQMSRPTSWLHSHPQPCDPHRKFNLMEETHGSNWTKENPEKFLSYAECTIGTLSIYSYFFHIFPTIW